MPFGGSELSVGMMGLSPRANPPCLLCEAEQSDVGIVTVTGHDGLTSVLLPAQQPAVLCVNSQRVHCC